MKLIYAFIRQFQNILRMNNRLNKFPYKKVISQVNFIIANVRQLQNFFLLQNRLMKLPYDKAKNSCEAPKAYYKDYCRKDDSHCTGDFSTTILLNWIFYCQHFTRPIRKNAFWFNSSLIGYFFYVIWNKIPIWNIFYRNQEYDLDHTPPQIKEKIMSKSSLLMYFKRVIPEKGS